MSKRLFTLISGEKIHIEPGSKIIPKNDYQTLIDSEKVLSQVKLDAETFRKDVVKEIEEIKQKAVEDGYEEGYNQWVEHVAKLEHEIDQVRKDYEKIIVPVLMKAVKKIVGRELESRDDAIIDIVKSSLKAVSTHKKITLFVSPKEKGILDENKTKLKTLFEQLEVFVIRERNDLEPGNFIIESEGGIINGRLENQFQILEKAFINLFKTKV